MSVAPCLHQCQASVQTLRLLFSWYSLLCTSVRSFCPRLFVHFLYMAAWNCLLHFDACRLGCGRAGRTRGPRRRGEGAPLPAGPPRSRRGKKKNLVRSLKQRGGNARAEPSRAEPRPARDAPAPRQDLPCRCPAGFRGSLRQVFLGANLETKERGSGTSLSTEARTELQPGMAQPARPRSRRWIGPSPDCERGAPGPCTPGLGGPQA